MANQGLLRVELVDHTQPIEACVDQDIAEFDTFFRSLGNDPLVRSERAILKTFLAHKLGLMKKSEEETEPR